MGNNQTSPPPNNTSTNSRQQTPPIYRVSSGSSPAVNRVSGSNAGQSNVSGSSAGQSNVSGSSAGQSNVSGSSASRSTNSETPRTNPPVFQKPTNSSSNQSTANTLKKNEETLQNNSKQPIPPSRTRVQPRKFGNNFQSPAVKQSAGQSFTRGPQNMEGTQNMGGLQSSGHPQNVNPSFMNPPSVGVYLQMPSVPSISIGPPSNMGLHSGTHMNPHMMPVNNPAPPHMATLYPRIPSPHDYLGPPLNSQCTIPPPAVNAIPPLMSSSNPSSRFENQRGRQWNQKPGPAKFNNNLKVTNDLDAEKPSSSSTSENKSFNSVKDSAKEKNNSGGNKGKRGPSTDLWQELVNLKIELENENSSKKKLSSEISELMMKVPSSTITSKENFIKELSEFFQLVNKMPEEEKADDSGRNPRRNYKTNFKKHYNSGGPSSSSRADRDYQTSEGNQGYSHHSSNFHRGRGGFRGNNNYRRPQGQDGEDEASNRERGGFRGNNNYDRRFSQGSDRRDEENNRERGGFKGNNNYNRGFSQRTDRGDEECNRNRPYYNRGNSHQKFAQNANTDNANKQSDDDNCSDAASQHSEPVTNRGKGGNFRGNRYSRRGGNQQYGRDQENNEKQLDDDNGSDDAASMCSEPPNNNRRRGGGGRFRGRGNWRGQWKRRGNSRSSNMRKAISEEGLTQENVDKQEEEDENNQNQPEHKLIDFESEEEDSAPEEDDSFASEDTMNLFIGKEIPSLMDAILAKINVMLKVKNCIMIAHEEKGIVKEKPDTLLDIIQFKELYEDAVVLNEQ